MKRISIFLLLPILFLIGCNNSEPTITDNLKEKLSKGYVHTYQNDEGQTFHIISGYKRIYQFAKAAEEKPDQLDDLWKKKVTDPTWDKCFKYGRYLELVNRFIAGPPDVSTAVIEKQAIALAKLNIEKTVVKSLKESSKVLPGPDTNVCIFPVVNKYRYTRGVTVGAGKISIFYNTKNLHHDFLLGMTAHEYYHSAWTKKYKRSPGFNLLENMIFEGRAEYFKYKMYPKSPRKSIFLKKERTLWKDVKEHLNSIESGYNGRAVFGGGKFPRGYGYVVGYHIVKAYVENHPDASLEDWSKISAKELYQKSGYEQWLYQSSNTDRKEE